MIPCELSTAWLDERGRPHIHVNGKRVFQCRHIYSTYHNIELTSKDVIRHKCDNPRCIEITHLEIGTQADNMRDCKERGRWPNQKGEANNSARFTEKDILDIRRMRNMGYSQKEIAEEYECSRTAIYHILIGDRWSHLQGDDLLSSKSTSQE